jgi:hypothetical protein
MMMSGVVCERGCRGTPAAGSGGLGLGLLGMRYDVDGKVEETLGMPFSKFVLQLKTWMDHVTFHFYQSLFDIRINGR